MKYLKIFTLFFLLALILILIFNNYKKNNKDQVTFLNTGQGSGTFLETKEGVKVLIDLSNKDISQKSLLKKIGFFDRKIDFLFLTHYDIDHVGGFLDLFNRYKVKAFFTSSVVPKNEDQKEVYDLIFNNLKKYNINFFEINAGDILKISENIYIKILYPFEELNLNNMKANETSLVLQIIFLNKNNEEKKVLITGDLSSKMEAFLIKKYKNNLRSEILLAGHHGSKTSSSEIFLKTVFPKYFIVQAGINNPYGHPNKEVLDRVRKLGIKILESSKNGNQTFSFEENDFILEK